MRNEIVYSTLDPYLQIEDITGPGKLMRHFKITGPVNVVRAFYNQYIVDYPKEQYFTAITELESDDENSSIIISRQRWAIE